MNRSKIISSILLFWFVTVLTSSCNTKKIPYYHDDDIDWQSNKHNSDNKKVHTLWLIGDTGELEEEVTPANYVVDAMRTLVDIKDKNSSIVFLGDNIYPKGMPLEKAENREFSEKIIQSQMNPFKSYEGELYFIPGNHDWNKHKSGGLEAIQRQEAFVMEHGTNVKFFPENGCGGPEVVKINSDLVFVFIDSQWWLQDWSKEAKINQGCDIKSRGDLLI